MAFPEFERLSPNRAGSPPHERRGVVFHHAELGFAESIERISRPESRVSYHCVVAEDGARAALVPDAEIAWHAGVSSFRGRQNCNAFLLGLSFAGDTDRAPLTERQIASALEWLEARWTPLGWSIDWMTDHRQVAPGRKRDLNPAQWLRLRASIAAHFP
ncbi:MAG: N-acetylmuramoyl-L-alanine amidase [Opitutaceae bacterium]